MGSSNLGVTERSCGIVTFRNGPDGREYLFLNRSQGFLDYTKGHIEEGETELEAAMRETREECGLSPRIIQGFREVMNYSYRLSGQHMMKEVVMFIGEVDYGLKVRISDEHVGHVWLRYDRAMETLTFQNQKTLLEKAENFLRNHSSGH